MKMDWYFDVDTVSKARFLEVIKREMDSGNMEYRFDNWNISRPFHFQEKKRPSLSALQDQ